MGIVRHPGRFAHALGALALLALACAPGSTAGAVGGGDRAHPRRGSRGDGVGSVTRLEAAVHRVLGAGVAVATLFPALSLWLPGLLGG